MTTNKERSVEVMRNFWHDGRYAVGFDEIADALADAGLLTPDPKPRPLADMTSEEREACRWMQADFDDEMIEPPMRVVITKIYPTVADIVLPHGNVGCVSHDKLTPLPELPRMVWPEEQARTHIDEAKPRAVLARLDREYAALADSNPRLGRDECVDGYLSGIDTARTWLQKALEEQA